MRELTKNEVQEVNGGAVTIAFLGVLAVGSLLGLAVYTICKKMK